LREKQLPDDWRTFNSRSILGGTGLGQKKYADAEPFLLSGYEGTATMTWRNCCANTAATKKLLWQPANTVMMPVPPQKKSAQKSVSRSASKHLYMANSQFEFLRTGFALPCLDGPTGQSG
jgi:hypothetical protein